ncbi:MAG: site-specific DNA-methyltransferase [Endomicrobium sp.]|nr:site-specific DNA-methyltransferase [Endomicrobium sp.]
MQEKYKEKIQCIYIDPPFNLDKNASFDYKVNYKDAIWATILENRLKIAKKFLKDTGSIFVRCDYNGNWIVRPILDNYFQYTNEIIISKSAKLTEQINRYHSGHDTLYFYTKTEKHDFETAKRKRNEPKWRAMHLPGIRLSPIPEKFIKLFSKNNVVEKKGNFYTKARIILGKELLPPNGRHWALSQEAIVNLEKENKIRLSDKDEPQTQESEWQRLTDNWTDYVGYSSTWGFTTENHEKIIERAITTSSLQKQEIIFDFFSGSGTTVAVAQKLNKKWLGIEMGQQFFNIDIPRMKEVLFGKGIHEPTGISKEVHWKGGGFFKYYSLEQYENTLRNMKYSNNTPSALWDNKNPFETYIFKADQKFADVLSIENEILEVDFDKLYKDIDFAETISNRKGLPIKRITKTGVLLDGESKEIKTDYKNMTNSEKIEFIKLLKPLLWWGE